MFSLSEVWECQGVSLLLANRRSERTDPSTRGWDGMRVVARDLVEPEHIREGVAEA